MEQSIRPFVRHDMTSLNTLYIELVHSDATSHLLTPPAQHPVTPLCTFADQHAALYNRARATATLAQSSTPARPDVFH